MIYRYEYVRKAWFSVVNGKSADWHSTSTYVKIKMNFYVNFQKGGWRNVYCSL